MKFGVILPNYGIGAGRLAVLDTALAAETLGYDSVWSTDHLALPEADAEPYTPILEALTTLAYLAGSSARVRLGVSALVLPQRSPLEVAKEMATLDVLSGGRAMLAVGIGWSQSEYANLGHEFTNRGPRMDEAVMVLRTAWRGSRTISYQGKHYQFDKASFAPGPIQAGGPPLWVAGKSAKALRRAVMLADGWHPTSMPPTEIERMLRVVRPLLLNRPFTISPRLALSFEASDNPDIALRGNSAQIIEQISAYRQVGVNYIVLGFQAESQSGRERAMRRFAADIMPQFLG